MRIGTLSIINIIVVLYSGCPQRTFTASIQNLAVLHLNRTTYWFKVNRSCSLCGETTSLKQMIHVTASDQLVKGSKVRTERHIKGYENGSIHIGPLSRESSEQQWRRTWESMGDLIPQSPNLNTERQMATILCCSRTELVQNQSVTTFSRCWQWHHCKY